LNKKVPKEFWIVTLVFVAMLAALAIPVAFGELSPRVFALLVVIFSAFPFLRYWSLFQAAVEEPQQSEAAKTAHRLSQVRSTIRTAKIRIGVLIAFACFALWETRTGPLTPRLVGLGFLLLLLAGNIRTLTHARRTFERLNPGE